MLAHVDEARSVSLRQRLGRRAPSTLADDASPDGGGTSGDKTDATAAPMTAADYMPATGDGKRWTIPVVVGTGVGIGLTLIGCWAMGGKKK